MLTPDPAKQPQAWRITAFASHEAVICLKCKTPLGLIAPECAQIGLGWRKRCPKCHLAVSYGVSPAEAAAISLEEPEWGSRLAFYVKRFPNLPRYLAEDSAFEETLREWKRFHKKPSADGMIALARSGIFPPRNLIQDTPRDGKCLQEQYDDHCWITMSQRAWKIVAIESRIMFCESFGEKTQVNLSKAKWEKHTEKALEMLNARREAEKNRTS